MVSLLSNPAPTTSPLLTPLFFLILIALTISLLETLIGNLDEYAWDLLKDYLNRFVQKGVLLKNLELDFAYFENPTFYDKLSKVEREAGWRPGNVMNSAAQILRTFTTLLSVLALLLTLGGWVVALLIIVNIPLLVAGFKYAKYRYTITDSRTPLSRKVNYLTGLISGEAVSEVRLFNLGDYLLNKFLSFYQNFIQETQGFVKKRFFTNLFLGLVSDLTYYGVYLWIILKTLIRQFTLGDLTLYSGAFGRAQSSLQRMLSNISQTYEHYLFLTDYFDFMQLKPKIVSPVHGVKLKKVVEPGIEFRNVSFRYTEDGPDILKNINLKISPNENIAIVGENGAGKTTLIKLLGRIYDPQKGRISINGVGLKNYDLPFLYKKTGILLQNFVRYQLTVAENIGFGNLEKLDDFAAIEKAARKAGAAEFVEKLPQKYQTVLGRRFEDGVDLSLGQWQRLALARAFMREAEILILDEPTASLDAKAEYEIFKKFIELTQGKITILISHRFSTVRLAQKIYVLHEGQIIEQGSHEELMEQKGLYAEMFTLQARGYQ